MDENKPLTSKELRELLGYYYKNLPSDDEEMIKEARDTYLKFKRIHKNCIPKLKGQEVFDEGELNILRETLSYYIHDATHDDPKGNCGLYYNKGKFKRFNDVLEKIKQHHLSIFDEQKRYNSR